MFPRFDCLIPTQMVTLFDHLAFDREICQAAKPSFSPMRLSLRRSLALCALLFTATIAAPPALASSKETITMSVGRLLEEGHYTRQKLNEEISNKFLQTY